MKRVALAAVSLVTACGARSPFDQGDGGSPWLVASAGGAASCPSCTGPAGASQSGGTSAAAGTGGGGAGAGGCDGRPGPPMRAIAETRGVRCVDATEVMNAHYAAFLGSSPSVAGQPAACLANTTFVPAFEPGVGSSTVGVRPNSPPHKINVSSSIPRCLRSLINAPIA